MQHLNNDMEELFRKAADNYPLKSDGADFNKILSGLNRDQEAVKKFSENKKSRKFLWLLLLLPLGYTCLLQLNKLKTSDSAGIHPLKEHKIAIKDHHQLSHPENLQKKNHPDNSNNNASGLAAVKTDHASKAAKDITVFTHNPNFASNDRFTGSQERLSQNNIPGFLSPKIFSSGQQIVKKDIHLYDKNVEAPILIDNPSNVHPTVVFPGKSGADNMVSPAGKGQAITGKYAGNRSHKIGDRFYAGLMAGIDFSTVKFQSVQHTGFNIGVLAGYQLNHKFSIETGLWWDRKKYYSDGKYLNTVKLNLPYNVKVIDLNGSCNMLEIPLNIRYNISDHKKGKLFATAGISSYIMMNEDYNYAAENMGYYYDAYSSYKNGTKNFLSVMHASVGYESPVGKAGKIRIEPYLKIPLHGVGTGSLPIMSTGINVGFTPKFK